MAGSSAEVERLRAVYDAYDRDGAARARWDPANPGNRAIHDERTARLLDRLTTLPGPVVDLGCGTGQVLDELGRAGALPTPAIGIDLSAARLADAASGRPGPAFVQAEGSALPLRDEAVGSVVAFTLFSSLLDPGLAGAVAREVARVVRPGGVVLWYDLRLRNPRNPAVRAWRREDVTALFPGWHLDLEPVTVFPPLARRLGRATSALYPALARVRPLTTHLLGAVRRPA